MVFLTSVVSDEENIQPKKGLYLGQGVHEPGKGIHHWMVRCFDLKTGEQRWEHEAKTGHPEVPRHPKASYASETATTDGERLYVLFGDVGLFCYDLDGDLLWELDGNMSNLVIPSPFAAHGLCYISSGYVGDAHRPTFAVRPGAAGDITHDDDFAESEFIEWYQGTSSAYNTSQIVDGDYLYTLYDQGFLTCHEAKTGKEVYGKQRFAPKGSFTSSPWAYNGKLFCLSEDGLTYVVQPGPEFEILGTNPLDELTLSTPAIAQGKLLIRTAAKLYCITADGPADQAATTVEPAAANQ